VKNLLLTYDVEEFDWRLGGGRPLPQSEQIGITAEGLRKVLPIHERHRAPATFFVTGAFALAEPGLLTEMAQTGHEVAVHGLAHGDDYANLEPTVAIDRLKRARKIVEAASGQEAVGMRTPRLRHCLAFVVRDAGFSYDASPHPTWIPPRYFGLHYPRSPWRKEGILKVPISVLPFLRMPARVSVFSPPASLCFGPPTSISTSIRGRRCPFGRSAPRRRFPSGPALSSSMPLTAS
jgi:hypothetical protein